MNVASFLTSCDGKWRRAEPASPASIVALAEKSGLELPTDYLSFLRQCNGGDGFLNVQPCYLRVWNAEIVLDYNLNYEMPENVPGFFAFGDAGGGEFFAFDTRGPQPWPVVSIPYVPMEASAAWSIASTFSDLLDHVIPANEVP
jgi:hypothetical protein